MTTTGDDIQLVSFRVGTQEFAFDILQVERILRHVVPAPLPKAPDFLEGVVPYEGGAVPVVDLRKRFDLDAPIREETRLMVIDLGEHRVGVLVDEVREVMRVDSTTITAPGPMVSGLAASYIAGIVTRPGSDHHHPQRPKPALLDRAQGAERHREQPMSEQWLTALRSQYQAIESRLGSGQQAEREAVKRDIIALFKRVDGALTDLGQMKEDIRGLVERYKQGAAAEVATAPQFTGARPAIHADHLGASTYIEKGWSLISLGDYAGAIQSLEKALSLSPGDVQGQSLLGWAQMLHEDYDDALGTFSRVLMKEPANALARINVGYICLKKRIFGEAIEHLSKAIRLDNDRKATLYAHYYLGLVYLEREMFEDAQTFFRKTLKLGPNLIEAYFELGRALWFAGQRDEAMQTWSEGHKANKFNPWAKRCKEMLDVAAAGGEVPRSLVS